MGSPINVVGACLFMETLEKDSLFRIRGRRATCMRYVDDVLVVTPSNTDRNNKLRTLDNVHEKIQFTVEEKVEGS